MQKNNLAIILSGGLGRRFNKKKPKQFFKINNLTIIEKSVNKFVESKLFDKIIIVSHNKFIKDTRLLFKNKQINIVKGGKTRQESVFNGLKEAKKKIQNIFLFMTQLDPFSA